MNILPAPVGTYVIEREQGAKEARKIPVIGFTHVQGGIVFPLCAINTGGLTRGRALLTADGFVTDPSYGVVCGNVDEWMVLTNAGAYWSAKDKTPAMAPQEAASDDEDYQGDDSAAKAAALAKLPATPVAARIPDKPKGKPQKFINKTFWQGISDPRDPSQNFLFVVEGGDDAPPKNDPKFDKIKRDEYMALKKAGNVVVEDWQTGVVAESGSHISGDPTDDEEEPDGSNLI